MIELIPFLGFAFQKLPDVPGLDKIRLKLARFHGELIFGLQEKTIQVDWPPVVRVLDGS